MITAIVHVGLEVFCAGVIATVVLLLCAMANNERRDRKRQAAERLAADRAAVARNARALGITTASDLDRSIARAIGVTRNPAMYAGLVDELLLRRQAHEREQGSGR